MSLLPTLLLVAAQVLAQPKSVTTKPLVELGVLLQVLAPTTNLNLAQNQALTALTALAAKAPPALVATAAAQTAGLPAKKTQATGQALMASAAVALQGIGAQDIAKMSPEAAQALAAKVLGEFHSLPAASAIAATAEQGAPPTAGLVEVLRSRAKTRALLASMGPGYEKIDPLVFATQARAVYAMAPEKAASKTLTQLREKEVRVNNARTDSIVRVLDRAHLLVGQNFVDAVALIESRDPQKAIAAAQRLKAVLAALPSTPRRTEALGDLEKILESQRRLKALIDLPLLTAEGMTRSRVHTPSQEQIEKTQLSWPKDASGKPVADLVVVGAGPAGLATGVHATAYGLKTVVLEAGYLAQSFADAAMKPIYRMRTPATRNSLVQAPFSPEDLLASVGMLARLKVFRARGQLADEALFKATGRPMLGGARENMGLEDGTVPSARNELLQHYAEIAEEMIARGGILREQNPVVKVDKRADGLWVIESADGSVQLARQLVLAQGQVGVETEYGNFGQDLDLVAQSFPEHFIALRDRRSLTQLAGQLHTMLTTLKRGRQAKRMFVHDALLGAPEVERALQLLPAGARVAIVGSGESAVKAAMAVLRQNPSIKVDLFTQGELTPNQLQVPAKHVDPEFIKQAIADPKTAEECIKEWQAFGVPVTPGTIADLKQQVAAGRLMIHPLGKKLVLGLPGHTDEKATAVVRLRMKGGRTVLELHDAENPQLLLASIDGPIVTATGYSRRALRQDALTQQLLQQGRIRFKKVPGKALEHELVLDSQSPFSSALDPDLYIIGAQNYGISADSTIPGSVARAAMTVSHIRLKLEASEPKITPPTPRGGDGRRPVPFIRRLARWFGLYD